MSNREKKAVLPRSKKRKALPQKARLNSVDIFIIVVLLLCIIGIGLRDTIADSIIKDDPYTSVDIFLYAEDLTPGELTQIKIGNELFVDGVKLGEVADIDPDPAKKVVSKVDESGATVWTEVVDNEHYSVSLKVTVAGRYTSNGLYIQDNIDLYVGKILNIEAASYSLTVTITEIPRI